MNCFEKKFSTANLNPFELRVGLRIIILKRNSRTISLRTRFFCPIIRLPHFDNLNDRDERRLGEVLSCSGRFWTSSHTSEIPTLFNVSSHSPDHGTNFLSPNYLKFVFTDRDRSLVFVLLDFGGLSVCTGSLRHNQYSPDTRKSVLFLHQQTMLKIVFVGNLNFLYSVVSWRAGIMTSGYNLGNRAAGFPENTRRGLFVL